jgi:hypothetical protein
LLASMATMMAAAAVRSLNSIYARVMLGVVWVTGFYAYIRAMLGFHLDLWVRIIGGMVPFVNGFVGCRSVMDDAFRLSHADPHQIALYCQPVWFIPAMVTWNIAITVVMLVVAVRAMNRASI